MLRVKDIYDYIDEIAPFCGQCDWDNGGLLVGSKDSPVRKVGVVLDITPDAVTYAKENGIDLIVSHHPVIFSPLTHLCSNEPAYLLAQGGIAAVCAHTSLDAAKGGVNDVLASVLGFSGAMAVETDGEERVVRICTLEKAVTARELAQAVKSTLNTPVILCECANEIKKIALCGGAGGDFINFAVENACDAYITGEMRHHEMLAARQIGLTVVAAGHFETENPVVASLAQRIAERFDVPVEIIPQASPARIV